MMVEIDSRVIAEVRNALQIIMNTAQYNLPGVREEVIVKQGKRIVSLLPQVKFEG